MQNKNFDSDFCGNLPINFINSIQDHGFLLVVDKESFEVIQVSENLPVLLGISPQEFIRENLKAFLHGNEVNILDEYLSNDKENGGLFRLKFSFGEKVLELQASLHVYQNYFTLELEEYSAREDHSFIYVYRRVRNLINAIDSCKTVEETCQKTIDAIKEFSGFHSVLLYKFDSDWNGTVLAETNDLQKEKYFGLKFPASDIPRKAREMYLKNIYRLIPNRDYVPVKLFPVINPHTNAFTDLTDCNFRAVPGVHLEYMANMGIKASMSIRIIKDGQLWGLISCHHNEAKYLSYEQCYIFELISTLVSNKISSMINLEIYHFDKQLQILGNELTEKMYHLGDFISAFFNPKEANILKLFNSTGAIVILNGEITSIGEVINKDQVENLVLWSQAKKIGRVFASDHFSDVFEDANDYIDVASGILIIPLSPENGDYIFIFRPEIVRTVNWAGNPNEAINFEADGKKYHPRNSFEIWKEVVKNQSVRWHQTEIELANHFKSVFFEFRAKYLHN